MKAESKDIEVMGGIRLSTVKLPPVRAFVLSKKLLPIIAPLLGGITNLENMDVGNFARGFSQLSDAEQLKMMFDIFASTTAVVNGEIEQLNNEQNINAAFPDLFSLYDGLWRVVGFNFFPTGVVELLQGAIKKAIALRSTSPT